MFVVTVLPLYSLVSGSLHYFVSIPSESHREAWTMVMLMLLTKTFLLNDEKVCPASHVICCVTACFVVTVQSPHKDLL